MRTKSGVPAHDIDIGAERKTEPKRREDELDADDAAKDRAEHDCPDRNA